MLIIPKGPPLHFLAQCDIFLKERFLALGIAPTLDVLVLLGYFNIIAITMNNDMPTRSSRIFPPILRLKIVHEVYNAIIIINFNV